MRTAVIFAATVATAGLLLAPAGLATAETSPTETIGLLEAEGYTVNVDRIGNAPTDECIVTSVRNPQTVTKLVRVERRGSHNGNGQGNGNGNGRRDKDYDLVPVVVSKSISVSLNCAT